MQSLKSLLFVSASICLSSLAAHNLSVTAMAKALSAGVQTAAEVYEGPPIAILAIDDGTVRLMDADSYLWHRGPLPGNQWTRTARRFVPGTPIPNASETIGVLESTFGSE